MGGTAEAPGLGGGDSTAGRKLRERMMSELLISHSCDLSTFWVITTHTRISKGSLCSSGGLLNKELLDLPGFSAILLVIDSITSKTVSREC